MNKGIQWDLMGDCNPVEWDFIGFYGDVVRVAQEKIVYFNRN